MELKISVGILEIGYRSKEKIQKAKVCCPYLIIREIIIYFSNYKISNLKKKKQLPAKKIQKDLSIYI